MPIEVTARDTDTGETKTEMLAPGRYVVVCADPAYVDAEQVFGNGTAKVVIKRRPLFEAPPTVHFLGGHRRACAAGSGEHSRDPEQVTCGRCIRTTVWLDAAIAAKLTCGDCEEGRCHWGSARPASGGRCGCARHDASARKAKLAAAGETGEAEGA
jgi:hypothetical protein